MDTTSSQSRPARDGRAVARADAPTPATGPANDRAPEHGADAAVDDPMPGSPGESLALLEDQQRRAEAALDVDVRLLYGVWGGAWLVGFLLLWATSPVRDAPLVALSPGAAGAVFAALLVAATVVTGVQTARAARGIRGVSARASSMFGWAWLLSFVTVALVMTALGRVVQSPEVDSLLWPALVGLVVGVLYLTGGALWQDRVQYSIGVWLLAAAAGGAWVGVPENYLVMALGGGGGFLVAAAGQTVYRARQQGARRRS